MSKFTLFVVAPNEPTETRARTYVNYRPLSLSPLDCAQSLGLIQGRAHLSRVSFFNFLFFEKKTKTEKINEIKKSENFQKTEGYQETNQVSFLFICDDLENMFLSKKYIFRKKIKSRNKKGGQKVGYFTLFFYCEESFQINYRFDTILKRNKYSLF